MYVDILASVYCTGKVSKDFIVINNDKDLCVRQALVVIVDLVQLVTAISKIYMAAVYLVCKRQTYQLALINRALQQSLYCLTFHRL